MEISVLDNKVKVKGTTELNFDVTIVRANDPLARLERRIDSFMGNSDWIYDTISLFNKLLNGELAFSKLEKLALERLDLKVIIQEDGYTIEDRYYAVVDLEKLSELKEKIISLTTVYANKLLRTPKLHHMEKFFKKTLRKSVARILTPEEHNVLREAYLTVKSGKLVNLRDEEVFVPKYSFFQVLSGRK